MVFSTLVQNRIIARSTCRSTSDQEDPRQDPTRLHSSEPTHPTTRPTGLANLRSQNSHHANPIIIFGPGYNRPPFRQPCPKITRPFVYLPPLSCSKVKRPTQTRTRALVQDPPCSIRVHSPHPRSVASEPPHTHIHAHTLRFCHPMSCQATPRKVPHRETSDLRIRCYRYMYMYACVYVAASSMHAICQGCSPPNLAVVICAHYYVPLLTLQARTTEQTTDPQPLINPESSINSHEPSNNVPRDSIIISTSPPARKAAEPSQPVSPAKLCLTCILRTQPLLDRGMEIRRRTSRHVRRLVSSPARLVLPTLNNVTNPSKRPEKRE